ncbi:MAG: AAA family ATPase [Candidatus Nanopelagicales bacterium]
MDAVIGRDAELGWLTGLLADATEGGGRVVLVEGRPGIGKSRLVRQLVLGATQVSVGTGVCLAGGGAPPLWPWQRALRGFDIAAAVASDADERQGPQPALRRLAQIADDVLARAGREPMLVVLEDLHWADAASCDLLRLIVPDVTDSGLLLVATYRPDGGPATDRLALVRDEPGCERLTLRPLRDADAEALVHDHRSGLSDAIVRSIRAAAAGNPLYLRWLAERAADDHAEPVEPFATRTLRTDSLAQPMLATLQPGDRAIVEAAALSLMTPDADLLAEVCSVTPVDVRSALDRAVGCGLLSSADPVDWQHDLLRDSVVASVKGMTRQALHARYAEVLTGTLRADAASAASVARHMTESGDDRLIGSAAPYARRAADEARQAGAWWDEADLRQLAQSSLVHRGASRREVASGAADLTLALFRSGDLPGSVRAAADAVRAAVDAADPETAARAATVISGVDDADVRAALTEMIARVLTLDGLSAASRARLMASDAVNRFMGLPPREATELGEQALDAARAAHDPSAILEACRLLVAVPRPPDELSVRLALSDEAETAARALGDPLAMMWPLLWRIEALLALGRGAAAVVDDLAALADDCRLPLVRWHTCRARAAFAATAGRTDEAHALSAAADVLGRQLGDGTAAGLGVAFELVDRMVTGEPVVPTPELERALLAAPADIPGVVADQAYFFAATGRPVEAKAALAALATTYDVTLHDQRVVGALMIAVRVAAMIGDLDSLGRARAALARSTPADGGLGSTTIAVFGAIAYSLGEADEALGRPDSAVEHYRRALVVNARMGAIVPGALARVALVRGLLAVGTPDARKEARDQVVVARLELAAVELPTLARDLERIAQALGAETAGPLTAREEEVLHLVTEGLTNRQIADRLVLSERTVETHVRHILGKLDLSRREDAIAWSLRR